MLRWHEDRMPRDISKVKREVGILGIRRMVERKMEENQGMLKEEVMKDGVKKGVFREGNSPNERLDFGKHAGKTSRDVYLNDQGVLQLDYETRETGDEEVGAVQVLSQESGTLD